MIDGFSHNLHTVLVTDIGHDLERFLFQALKGIWRRAWLVGSATKELRSGAMHAFGNRKRLRSALDGAGPGNDGQTRAAKGSVGSGE